MSISISVRNKPYLTSTYAKSHLPFSPYSVEVFVTELQVGSALFSLENSLPLTTTLDLERGCVTLHNQSCMYRLSHEGRELVLLNKKTKEEKRVSCDLSAFPRKGIPRISFGCHKKQDAHAILMRKQIDEYLPFIYHLGKTFEQGEVPHTGVGQLLYDLEHAIENEERSALEPLWQKFFTLACTSLLYFDVTDSVKSGIGHCKTTHTALLSFAADLIEKMLLQKDEFLPALPLPLHAGRYVSGPLDFEWSKKAIRRAVVRPQKKETKSFGQSFRYDGKVSNTLEVEPGMSYLLDRFQK